MNSSKKSLMVTVVGLTACVAAGAQTDTGGSMFKNAPSISAPSSGKAPSIRTNPNGKLRERQPLSADTLSDGRISVKGPLHGGGGVPMQIVMPKINGHVEWNGSAGFDENGHPITWKQKRDRAIAHALVYQGLKAQGYDFKEHRKNFEASGVKTQADIWKEKTEQTRKYVQKHGAITTQDFIIPGTTPEKSALLNSKDVGVRMENGKRVYYLNGRRIDLATGKTETPKVIRTPVTTQKTRVKVSKRTMPENEAQAAKEGGNAQKRVNNKAQTADKGQKKPLNLQPNRNIQREPPKAVYVPDPDDDLRRSPLDTVIDPNALPGTEDVERRVREIFPDMSQNRMTVPEKLLAALLGVNEARAQIVPESRYANENLIGNLKQYIPSEQDTKSFEDAVNEIRASKDEVENALQSTAVGKENTKAQPAKAPLSVPIPADGYVDRVLGNTHFDPAQFAAEVVNKTQKSLTEQQFNDDVAAVVNSVNDSNTVIDALTDMLDSNPEIYQAIPDADKRLQALTGQPVEIAPPDPKGEKTYIFVSYSLSEKTLKEIFERNASRKDVTVVMRGVPDGMNIPYGVLKLQKLAAEAKADIPMLIDPGLFKAYGISKVPSVARTMREITPLTILPEQNKQRRYARLVAKVDGLNNDKWLKEQIEGGQTGDLGVQGSVSEIAEPDLIEEMKKRVALIDWEQKKKEAVKRFWKRQEFKVFPTAEKDRVREINPTILVERDIKDLAGRTIRKAGDRVNPLGIRPFTQTVLIFNPVSKDEIARVQALRNLAKQKGEKAPVLIATQVEKNKGWDGYQALTDLMDAHVFVMTPEIEYQWHIERTPSVITADNERHVFIVREVGPIENKTNAEK